MRYLLLFLLGTLFSCSTTKDQYRSAHLEDGEFAPPGTIKIPDEGFYADRGEITNSFYKEYLYWTRRIMGPNSQEYLNALPDTSVWSRDSFIVNAYDSIYFRSAEFDDFPVVGITAQQVNHYCKWRSDRVFEMMLIERGVVKPEPVQNRFQHFTIERYMYGKYKDYKPTRAWMVPIYTLPTEEEWMKLAGLEAGKQLFYEDTKENKKELKKRGHRFNTKEFFLSDKNKVKNGRNVFEFATSSVYSFSKNKYGLFGIIGNVAELLRGNKYVGGSWLDEEKEARKIKEFEQVNCWTGFRCIVRWRKIEVGEIKKSSGQ